MDKLAVAASAAAQGVARAWNAAWPGPNGRRPDGDHDHASERGQGMAEYALILSLIAVFAILALIFMGETISDLFWDPISSAINSVVDGL
jgi:Flp pilus assembly pilin Flp